MTGIQLWGNKKCADSKKAERFFKERNITIQQIDTAQKGLSKRELAVVIRALGEVSVLVNTTGKEYKRRNLAYIIHDTEAELLADPLLLKTPIVRWGNKATIGYEPETWKQWLEECK